MSAEIAVGAVDGHRVISRTYSAFARPLRTAAAAMSHSVVPLWARAATAVTATSPAAITARSR
jgi:hypothetical protein